MVFKTMPEIKHHVEDHHAQEKYGSVLYMKINSENIEAFDSKWNSYRDFFSKIDKKVKIDNIDTK